MPRIDPTAQQALYRLYRDEQQQAHDCLPVNNLPHSRGMHASKDHAKRLADAKRLIEAIEKLL